MDTKADAPTLQLNNPAGTNPAGETLTTASSFVLSGVAEKGAQVIVRSGSKEVGTATASITDGSWALTVNSTLEINGLRRVDGGLSAANGVYQLLTLDQVREVSSFSGADFSPDGYSTPSLDTSRPIYRMTTATGETWYVWSAINDDYRISRQSDSGEWYREILNSPKALGSSSSSYASFIDPGVEGKAQPRPPACSSAKSARWWRTTSAPMPMAKPSLFIRRAFWWRARRNRIPGPHQKNRQSMTARHRLPLRCC